VPPFFPINARARHEGTSTTFDEVQAARPCVRSSASERCMRRSTEAAFRQADELREIGDVPHIRQSRHCSRRNTLTPIVTLRREIVTLAREPWPIRTMSWDRGGPIHGQPRRSSTWRCGPPSTTAVLIRLVARRQTQPPNAQNLFRCGSSIVAGPSPNRSRRADCNKRSGVHEGV
jgi:hypothetical protein